MKAGLRSISGSVGLAIRRLECCTAVSHTLRIPAVVAAKPDIVIVAGGRNDLDETLPDAQIQADVTAAFTALRAGLPHALIIAVSPVWDDETTGAASHNRSRRADSRG